MGILTLDMFSLQSVSGLTNFLSIYIAFVFKFTGKTILYVIQERYLVLVNLI
jgi:hypothetical protein